MLNLLTSSPLPSLVLLSRNNSNHIQEREEMEQKPIFTVEGVTFVYVQYNNLILMSVTKRNSNVALMLVYLYKLVRGEPERKANLRRLLLGWI